jgi:hypothetical protein
LVKVAYRQGAKRWRILAGTCGPAVRSAIVAGATIDDAPQKLIKVSVVSQFEILKINKSSLVLSYKKEHSCMIKRFFFVKKKQKTFVTSSVSGLGAVSAYSQSD